MLELLLVNDVVDIQGIGFRPFFTIEAYHVGIGDKSTCTVDHKSRTGSYKIPVFTKMNNEFGTFFVALNVVVLTTVTDKEQENNGDDHCKDKAYANGNESFFLHINTD